VTQYPPDEALLARCPAELDAAIEFLRDEGYSKIQSIALIARKFDIGLGPAKEAVHFSAAWEDRRAQDDEFVDRLVDLAAKLED
jgi:hypothetical protein